MNLNRAVLVTSKILQQLGHQVTITSWDVSQTGAIQAICRVPACCQTFTLTGMEGKDIQWAVHGSNNSFSFLDSDEYVVVKNNTLLTVDKSMFCR